MKSVTASEAVIKTTAARNVGSSPGLQRSVRHYALEVFALLAGAVIWESLG